MLGSQITRSLGGISVLKWLDGGIHGHSVCGIGEGDVVSVSVLTGLTGDVCCSGVLDNNRAAIVALLQL